MWRRNIILISFFLSFPFLAKAQIPFECKGQYFLSLTKSNALSSQLYRIKIDPNGTNISLDTVSQDLTLILNAMGYRITDNLIYGLDPVKATLSRVGADGIAQYLGKPKGIPDAPIYYAGDITPDGRYLLAIGLASSPQIVKIDLEDPEYTCSFVPLKNPNISIVDIAFDPFSGILYGHDFRNERLVTIDPNTGDINSNFQQQPQVEQLGALFFDSFGNLYGYGSYNTMVQDKFVKIDKKTGEMTLAAKGPISSGQDGCACPYTMKLQKIAKPDTIFACSEFIYEFVVSNGSGTTRPNINLVDSMPYPLRPVKVLTNPYGGTVSINGNILSITGMIVPAGIDTIKVATEVYDHLIGEFRNQATLSGLPISLGSRTTSDNPFTFVENDSTSIWILPVDTSMFGLDYDVCKGDSVLFDGSKYGYQFVWSDGDTTAQKWLVSPSQHTLQVNTSCDVLVYDIMVSGEFINVNIIPEDIVIDLGDSVYLPSTYENIDDQVQFLWSSERVDTKLECVDCQNNTVFPLYDDIVNLWMTNAQGCIDRDSVMIRVRKNYVVFAPNIISANGDAKNDFFHLSGNDKTTRGLRLRIYDRWGNLVFVKNNFVLNNAADGWDGTFNGRNVAEGVYAWVADVEFIDKKVITVHGDVTVVR